MSDQQPRQTEVWASGAAYEPYVGRWSRFVAEKFFAWLDVPLGSRWLDVGCGTGALTQTILQQMAPMQVKGVDRSPDYVAYAQAHIRDDRVQFEVGDAQKIPAESGTYDAAVSGLMLNFVPQPSLVVEEMARTVRSGGTVALYVWDYADKMQLMRHFWDGAAAIDPAALELDEGRRFSVCNPQVLTELFQAAKLHSVEAQAIDIDTHFKDFDDYWSPFLLGQGPAPAYAMTLGEEQRTKLRDVIKAGLPIAADGSIPLVARAWAVRGRKE